MKWIFAFAFFLPAFTWAASSSYTIKQLQLAHKRVVVEGTTEIPVGTELIATFSNGTQCPLKVTASQGRLANADVSDCASAKSLVAGQSLERSLMISESAPSSPRPRAATKSTSDSTASTGSKWTPRSAPKRNLTDLQYFPNEGQLAMKYTYVYSQLSSSQTLSPGNQKVYDNTIESHLASFELLSAPRQDLNWGFQLTYLLGQTESYKFGDGSSTPDTKEKHDTSGLGDPRVMVQYRVIEQDTSPIILDLRFAYSPNMGKNKSATSGHRGTYLRGGDRTTFAIDAGFKASQWSFLAGLSYDYFGLANHVNADTGVGTRFSPYNLYTLNLLAQMDLMTTPMYLRGGLTRVMIGDSSTNVPGGAETTIDSASQTILRAGVGHEFKPGQMAVDFTLKKLLSMDTSSKMGNNSLSSSIEGLTAELSLITAF